MKESLLTRIRDLLIKPSKEELEYRKEEYLHQERLKQERIKARRRREILEARRNPGRGGNIISKMIETLSKQAPHPNLKPDFTELTGEGFKPDFSQLEGDFEPNLDLFQNKKRTPFDIL